MKILYAGMRYDYGKKERGYSFEHYNFYESLVKMEEEKHQIIYFPFDEIIAEAGKEEMNKRLLRIVEEERPDLCFFFLFTDEFEFDTIKKLSASGKTTTFAWFSDDHWRFDNYSKYCAPNFNWISTTDFEAIEKYARLGYENVIKSQWACNNYIYFPEKPEEIGLKSGYEVSFIGQPHSNRKKIISNLQKEGIEVTCYGNGWPSGRISQEQMINMFRHSKVNLNLTQSSGKFSIGNIARIFLYKKNGKIKFKGLRRIGDDYKSFLGGMKEQIKGRNFEIPGCGGFLLTGQANDLGSYYVDGKEVVVFNDFAELAEKTKYYLEHDDERIKIARAGYERTIKDHTYEMRFKEIFKRIGLQ